jgi:uncharacterized protein (TIGR02186 family)
MSAAAIPYRAPMPRDATLGALALVLSAAMPLCAAAAPLVADLSSREIAITTGFSGADLLLFGATDGEGDVVVVVRGPVRREVVRRKERVAGIWINRTSVTFDDVPGFYFVASSRPLDEVAPARMLHKYQLGVSRLALPTAAPESDSIAKAFRDGLKRAMLMRQLYSHAIEPVLILGNRLFRTEIRFPASVPTGVYTAETFLFRGGALAAATKTPVIVRKAGVEARIYDFAHEQSALYGVVAIVIALMAGWLTGLIFRRI